MQAHLHVQVIIQAVLHMPALAVIARRPVPVLPQHMRPNLQRIQYAQTPSLSLTTTSACHVITQRKLSITSRFSMFN